MPVEDIFHRTFISTIGELPRGRVDKSPKSQICCCTTWTSITEAVGSRGPQRQEMAYEILIARTKMVGLHCTGLAGKCHAMNSCSSREV